MEARAYLRGLRMSPSKVKILLDLIRGRNTDLALATLRNSPRAACEPVAKLLKSAIANAENNHNMDAAHLFVAECFVTPGPTMKRIRPVGHGRAYRILKRSSHITIVLREKE